MLRYWCILSIAYLKCKYFLSLNLFIVGNNKELRDVMQKACQYLRRSTWDIITLEMVLENTVLNVNIVLHKQENIRAI